MLTQSKMRQLGGPSESSMRYIKTWMYKNGDGRYVYLTGSDNELWERTSPSDLIAVYTREYEDFISTWIPERALYWTHRYFIQKFFPKVSQSTSHLRSGTIGVNEVENQRGAGILACSDQSLFSKTCYEACVSPCYQRRILGPNHINSYAKFTSR